MRQTIAASLLTLALTLFSSCSSNTGSFHNALTGEACEPNDSYVPMDPTDPPHGQAGDHGNGNTSPTGIPGDNMDDLRSGKVDCYYDGNSGQGDDKKHPCAPGCDNQMCCDDGADPGDPDDGMGSPDGGAGGEPSSADAGAGGGSDTCVTPCAADGSCPLDQSCDDTGCCAFVVQ